MSTLLIDELYTGVVFTQHVRIRKSIQVAHIRPWIYKHGTITTGKFRCQIYDGATLLKQVDIENADLNSAFVELYAHGYIRFDVEPLALNVHPTEEYHDYTLKFSMIDYITDSSNYLATVREWDDRKYPIFGTSPLNDTTEPLGYELFNYKD